MKAGTAQALLMDMTERYYRHKYRLLHEVPARRYSVRKNPPIILSGRDVREAFDFFFFMGRLQKAIHAQVVAMGRRPPDPRFLREVRLGYAAVIKFIRARRRAHTVIIGARDAVQRMGRGPTVRDIAVRATFCSAVEFFATPSNNRALKKEFVAEQEAVLPDKWNAMWSFANKWLRACR